MRWTTLLIDHPWLSLIPAVLLLGLWAARRSRMSLVAAVLWLAYPGWEFAVKETSPDANIRVDLLLTYPLLTIATLPPSGSASARDHHEATAHQLGRCGARRLRLAG